MEKSKSEDLQDESIAHIAFEEKARVIVLYQLNIMRLYRILISCITGCMLLSASTCKAFLQVDTIHSMLDTLIVSGVRIGATHSAAPSQQIDADELRRLGVTNVGDAMKFMSGVTVKDYGGVGGLKTVSVRGMGAQHTAVFYDGVAIGDCQSGQVDLGRFSTDNLEGVQLTIGQGNDIYRPARVLASAATLFVETAMPRSNNLNVSLRTGSFNTYQAAIQCGRLLGKGWRMSLFTDYMTSGGKYNFDIENLRSSIKGKRLNSDIEAMRAETSFSWSGKRSLFRAKLYAYNSSQGVPGAVIVDNPLSSERLLTRNLFGQLFYELQPNNIIRMKAALKHNYVYNRNKQPAIHNCNRYRQHETDFSYTIAMYAAEWLSFAISEEAFYNTLRTSNRHNTMSSSPERLTILSAASMQLSLSNFSATASLLYSYASEWSNSGEVAPDRSRFSPSIAVAFSPFGKGMTLRASYKDIFRMPTFNDLYYRESGNYKLRPEKSRMFNAGLSYSYTSNSILKEMNIAMDAYYGAVKDKIVAVPGIFVWKMSNVNDVRLSGFDTNLSSAFAVNDKCDFKISAAYNYMYAVDDTEGSLFKGHQIIYTPRHSGSFAASLYTPLLDIGYSLVWSGDRYRLAQNIPSTRVDAYYDHSMWVSHDWNVGRGVLSAKIDAMNILGTNYEIIRYYPMAGRSLHLSLMLKL